MRDYWVARLIFRTISQLVLLVVCIGLWLWWMATVPEPIEGPGVTLVDGYMCVAQPHVPWADNITEWCRSHGATEYVRIAE